MRSATATTVLVNLAAGEFRLAASASVDDELSRISNPALDELNGGRIVALVWERLPSHTCILEEAIDRLADAALALWPQWYLSESNRETTGSSLQDLTDRAQRAGLERETLPFWMRLADVACQTQRPPRSPNDFTAEVEARQLALALGGQACKLVLAVRDATQDDIALLGLARTVEWLARETKFPLLALTPTAVAHSRELDSINFEMVELTDSVFTDGATTDAATETLAQPPPFEQPCPQKKTRPPRLIVRPLIGRPHPDSSGEQILWEKLQTDPELANLFHCNQWTSTVCDTTYLVDFIWVSGKLIVEVDGYYWHSSPYSFAYDRRRDYELHLSGHLVLRLPHDEVIADVDGAVKKIRLMVRMRQHAP